MVATREVINSILSEKCHCNLITQDMELKKDLGFDSLSLVELIVDLEDRFSITIDETDLDPTMINTVGKVYLLVEKYVG